MKVLVAMSGGVDSSLAAALLLDEGHEVEGITLRLADQPPGPDRPDPAAAAAALGIPFSEWDLRGEFERLVVAPFVGEYLSGRTPNPCARCNAAVKFGLLLERTAAAGADFLATGHYARLVAGPGGRGRLLVRGADRAKDQSYFLALVGRPALERVLFPLGGLRKGEVRALARARGLAAASRPESQEICFVPGDDCAAFVAGRARGGALAPGPIVDRAGRRLGEHRGLARYTVGQRRGLGLAAGRPLYVLALDAAANTLVVGPDELLWGRELAIEGVNWLADAPGAPLRAAVRIRSRHEPAAATLAPAGDGRWRARFDEPQRAITPGQAAVFYDGDVVLGGGTIA